MQADHDGGLINNKKCYDCGKVFRAPVNLLAHKNRKTPCLIRDITPEQRQNPLRCIFCNKILSRKEHLVRHLKICKIKNGGMEILDDKIRYDQEIRILKEQREQDRVQIEQLKENREFDRIQIEQLKDQSIQRIEEMKQLSLKPSIVNNGTINVVNVQFCKNIDEAIVDKVTFTQDDLIYGNVLQRFIEMIYFNKNIPENHIIYQPNIREDRLLVHDDGLWKNIVGEQIHSILVRMQNRAFLVGCDKFDKKYTSKEEVDKMYPTAREAMFSFTGAKEEARRTDEQLKAIILEHRELIAQTLRGQKII